MFLMFSTFTLVGYPQVNPEALVTCILCMWGLLLFYRLVYETIYLSGWVFSSSLAHSELFSFCSCCVSTMGQLWLFFFVQYLHSRIQAEGATNRRTLLVFIGKGKRKHDGSFTRSDTLLPLPCHQTKQVT